jgi:hypothetical protein
MKFKDVAVNRKERYSLGIEEESGRYYISILVSNRLVDYEEYYEIDKPAFERYRANLDSALELVKRARNRELDHLLMVPPGDDRGSAV